MRCGASCPGTELRDIKLLRCSLELAPQQPSVLQLMLQSSGPFCFSAVLFDIQDKDRGAAGIFGYLFFHYLWKACLNLQVALCIFTSGIVYLDVGLVLYLLYMKYSFPPQNLL